MNFINDITTLYSWSGAARVGFIVSCSPPVLRASWFGSLYNCYSKSSTELMRSTIF